MHTHSDLLAAYAGLTIPLLLRSNCAPPHVSMHSHLHAFTRKSVCVSVPALPAGVLAYNQDHARQRICNWLDGHKASAAAFDFPTKGILQYAVGNCEYWRLADSKNKPSGLLGWWPSKSVVSGGRGAAARGCVLGGWGDVQNR